MPGVSLAWGWSPLWHTLMVEASAVRLSMSTERVALGKTMKEWPGPRNHRPFSKRTLSLAWHVHVE